jgi:hypothetical protein
MKNTYIGLFFSLLTALTVVATNNAAHIDLKKLEADKRKLESDKSHHQFKANLTLSSMLHDPEILEVNYPDALANKNYHEQAAKIKDLFEKRKALDASLAAPELIAARQEIDVQITDTFNTQWDSLFSTISTKKCADSQKTEASLAVMRAHFLKRIYEHELEELQIQEREKALQKIDEELAEIEANKNLWTRFKEGDKLPLMTFALSVYVIFKR